MEVRLVLVTLITSVGNNFVKYVSFIKNHFKGETLKQHMVHLIIVDCDLLSGIFRQFRVNSLEASQQTEMRL